MISKSDIHFSGTGNYNVDMDRIGPKHPFRLFIREWMEHRHIDNERMAERMDCGPGTVSKLLNGKMKMTTEWMMGFADALDVAVPDLFRDPEQPTADDLLRNATPEQRVQAVAIIDALLKAG